jgi:flagellar basal-body rod protein FlgC
MGLFDAIDVAGSGLAAERLRMDVVAGNLANAQTTQGANGQPYRRREVVLQEATPPGASFGSALAGAIGGGPTAGTSSNPPANGVQVAGIVEDQAPLRRVYDPGHPDADAQGYVSLPNVNPVTEMVDLISASRAYEANVTAMQTAKTLFTKTLELLR